MRKIEDVAGARSRCPDFDPCPLCYGCRNYSDSYAKCVETCQSHPRDACNREKHTDKILAKMIRPAVIRI